MKEIMFLILISSLVGCVTNPIREPTTPPPPEWSGESGLEVIPGTIKLFEGRMKNGDSIVESEARFKRTGTLVETVESKTDSGDPLIIPKGTKMYAMNYWGPFNSKINPIEWCANLPDGINAKDKSRAMVCIFWEGENQVKYLSRTLYKTELFAGRFPNRNGVPGPMPKIIEEPLDFDSKIKFRIFAASIRDYGVVFAKQYTDGMTTAGNESFPLARWPDNGCDFFGIKNEFAAFAIEKLPDDNSIEVKIISKDAENSAEAKSQH